MTRSNAPQTHPLKNAGRQRLMKYNSSQNPSSQTEKNGSKVFTFHHRVLFNETNAAGGVVYFSNYAKWQGMVRELWFVDVVDDWREIMIASSTGKLNMITVEEHSHFIRHAHFGDKIEIQLRMTNPKSFSFEMIFLIYNADTRDLLYEGMQKLAFDDFNGKFVSIPESMKCRVMEYSVNAKELKLLKLKV